MTEVDSIPEDTRLVLWTELEAQFERAMAKELASAYLEDTAEVIDDLQLAILERDSARVKSLAHLLRGASKIVMAVKVEGATAQVETLCSEGQWLKLEACFEKLSNTFNMTVAELRQYIR
jgi:HPt (histidine-containing phosphotransfer) domain-containing protein